jgi:hypothetical protein
MGHILLARIRQWQVTPTHSTAAVELNDEIKVVQAAIRRLLRVIEQPESSDAVGRGPDDPAFISKPFGGGPGGAVAVYRSSSPRTIATHRPGAELQNVLVTGSANEQLDSVDRYGISYPHEQNGNDRPHILEIAPESVKTTD